MRIINSAFFFGAESGSEDIYKSFSEIEFDLAAADYVFPDVREDNASIGRFLDIYYFDMTEIRDTESAFIVIARYDVDGKTCYDTRVYMQREKDYCVDEERTQNLNRKYRDAEEYPITELFMLPQERKDSDVSDAEAVKDSGYSILTYTKAPNKNSLVRIQYPFLEGEGKETLNNLIFGKVQELAQIDDTLFPVDSALTVDYQAEITLQNAKIVSIVFWGTSSVGQSAYATNDVIPLNIDMRTVKEISFEELYVANEDFQKIFFEKAYLPTGPVTSCYEMSFAEMLALQSPEYQPVSPFSISGNVRCFLKQNALVLSMPSVHASGSDHFEAQIDYDDLEDFYLPEQEYWK